MMTSEKIAVPGGILRATWKVVAPFWVSYRNWQAWLLVAAMVGATTLTTFTQFASTLWAKNMVDAFTSYNLPRLVALSGILVLIGVLLAVTAVSDYFLNQWLMIRWRSWLTDRFLTFWLSNKTFYRIERDNLLDNPDQRISEDLGQLIQLSASLTLGLYGTLLKLVTFSSVLWSKAGTLRFHYHGTLWLIPGYMFWCAALYSMLQLGFLSVVGRPLMRVNFLKQRVEANFRFGMMGIRIHPEQIAMYDGGRAEFSRMNESFGQVRQNIWQVTWVEVRFRAVQKFLESLAGPLPILLAAPGYFSRAMTFGDVTQVGASFGVTVEQFTWFVRAYQDFQLYRVVVARLYGLQRAAEAPEPAVTTIDYDRVAQTEFTASDLHLHTPQNRNLIGPLSFRVKPGERWMVRGKSGVGKSTLMRALAGIWPYGVGEIRAPREGSVRFLPQLAYFPAGSLKAAMCYPLDPATMSDASCRDALLRAQLEVYVDRLDEVDRWNDRLSRGEQQRLALAGVLLQKPDFLFLDEATSALDSETEQRVYAAVLAGLPDATIVHVTHHPGLERYHDHVLDLNETVRSPLVTTLFPIPQE